MPDSECLCNVFAFVLSPGGADQPRLVHAALPDYSFQCLLALSISVRMHSHVICACICPFVHLPVPPSVCTSLYPRCLRQALAGDSGDTTRSL